VLIQWDIADVPEFIAELFPVADRFEISAACATASYDRATNTLSSGTRNSVDSTSEFLERTDASPGLH
jgi:hypothetical protein